MKGVKGEKHSLGKTKQNNQLHEANLQVCETSTKCEGYTYEYSFSISGTTAAIVKLLRVAKLRTAFTEVPHHQMAMVMRQYVLAGSQVHDEVAS